MLLPTFEVPRGSAAKMNFLGELGSEIISDDAYKIQASMNPLNLGLYFGSEYDDRIPQGSAPPQVPTEELSSLGLSDEEKTTLAKYGFVSRKATVEDIYGGLSDVPAWLIAHELSHHIQSTATSSGIRNFFELNVHQISCIKLIRAALSLTGGTIRVGVVDSAEGLWPKSAEFKSAWLTIDKSYTRLVAVNGGGRIRTSFARKHALASGGRGTIYRCKYLIPEIPVTWCADLTHFGGPSGVSVILGNKHLYEGYAYAVELLRALMDESVVESYMESLSHLPDEPYRIAVSIYRGLAGAPVGEVPELAELTVVLDTALMYDDWLTTRLDTPEKADTLWPNWQAFDYFIYMCETMGHDRARLSLRGMGNTEIVAFQDALLEATSAPVKSVRRLTEAAKEAYPRLISEIAYYVPPMRILAGTWSRAFEYQLSYRIDTAGGGCPAFRLIYSPRERLQFEAMAYTPSLSRASVPVTDGAESERDYYKLQLATHIRSVLDEVVLGRSPCPVREKCTLPRRAACEGITTRFKPEGHRCPREGAIAAIISGTGISDLLT
jgi:hypothetical protein